MSSSCVELQEPRRAMLFRVPRRPARPRRRKMAVARLGGPRSGGRLRLLLGALRRLRLRWLVVQYRRAVRRLRERYAAAMRELIVRAAALEAPPAPSRIIADSCFVPAAAAAAAGIPSCNSYYYIR